jgi:hypothetical protein
MKRLILLNGPRECGKSDAVKLLHAHFDLVERQCKDKVHELTQAFFSVSRERYYEIYLSRKLKDSPVPEFMVTGKAYQLLQNILGEQNPRYTGMVKMLSIREAMIYVSECLCKPSFGVDYFGIVRAKSITDGELAIDDSAGFEDELYPAIKLLGQKNIILIRIYGRGNFEGDSRRYIGDGVIDNTIDIHNNSTLDDYLDEIVHHVGAFIANPDLN